MWASKRSMEADYQIVNNKIVDAVYEGILLEANYALDKVTIKDNSIDGATYAVEVFEPTSNYGSGKLNAEISNNKTANLSVGFIKNNNPNAVINVIEEKEEKGTVVQSSDADENSISDEAVPAAANVEANNSGIFVFAGILGVILISAIYLAVQINKKYKNK